jgi:hypothetical protein
MLQVVRIITTGVYAFKWTAAEKTLSSGVAVTGWTSENEVCFKLNRRITFNDFYPVK